MKTDLSKIDLDLLENQLEACRALLAHYKDGVDMEHCPFCTNVNHYIDNETWVDDGCKLCPWDWFASAHCMTYTIERFGVSILRARIFGEHPEIIKHRIWQLPRWIKAIEREIERRE